MRERWASLAAMKLALSGYLGQVGRENFEMGGGTDFVQYCVIVLIGGINMHLYCMPHLETLSHSENST